MGDSITLQRRSLKVDVELSSFKTFALFEKHVESKFDVKQGVSAMDLFCFGSSLCTAVAQDPAEHSTTHSTERQILAECAVEW